jgi:hypothetical protein
MLIFALQRQSCRNGVGGGGEECLAESHTATAKLQRMIVEKLRKI